jgi:hypothetical protein
MEVSGHAREALLPFVIVCKGCVAKAPLPKGSRNQRLQPHTAVGCVFPRAEVLNAQLGIFCIQSGSINVVA